MDWYFICPKCGKEQDIIGVQYKSIEWCRATFRIAHGAIEIIDTYNWDSEIQELDEYFCDECGEPLTDEEIKEGIKKWLKKSGKFPEAVLKQLE